MKRLVSAVAEAPIVVANRHEAGNYTSTLDYIPGTALRGAIASLYLESAQLQQEVTDILKPDGLTFQDYFQWVFLSGWIRFPNLYPRRETLISFPIPLSARSCKRFPGFAEDSLPLDRRHGVYDVLLVEPPDFRCPERLGDRLTKYSPCQAPMEPFTGFYEGSLLDPREGRSRKVSRRILTRTAIENPTETVEQGLLYSLEALEEGGGSTPDFAGLLVLAPPDNLSDSRWSACVEVFLEHLRNPLAQLAVGRAKTRGLGTIRLAVAEDDVVDLLPALEERFRRLQEVWQQLHLGAPGESVFTLTLYSDAILLDDLWRYASVLDEGLLAQESVNAPAFTLKRWFTRTCPVGGWNAAHRMPKEDELGILKGSAFLYTTTASPALLLPWLQDLEERGIGERRNEGFGRIVACHPFHWGGVMQ